MVVSLFSGETEERNCTRSGGGWLRRRVEMVVCKVHLLSMEEVFFFNFSLKKTPLWKVSYEECSLFETSTTQMPILSCIESLAVHINTFQAQIKKCKQNKKIYIYIIFPLSKGFKSQCSKSFWTQNLRSTLFSWDKQVPAKATAFLTQGWGSWTAWKRERQENEKGTGMH